MTFILAGLMALLGLLVGPHDQVVFAICELPALVIAIGMIMNYLQRPVVRSGYVPAVAPPVDQPTMPIPVAETPEPQPAPEPEPLPDLDELPRAYPTTSTPASAQRSIHEPWEFDDLAEPDNVVDLTKRRAKTG